MPSGWMHPSDTQEQIDKLRALRAGFLDVAIEIEMDLRAMLVGYFVAEDGRRALFEDVYESQGTLGPVIQRFNKVLSEEAEPLTAAGVDIDALKAALAELRINRNTFAHQPMDTFVRVDPDTGKPIDSEMRIGKRYGDPDTCFTVKTAEEAFQNAVNCERLVLEMRLAFVGLPRR